MVNQGHYVFIRHYRAPWPPAVGLGADGTWYGEYDGTFSVREFVVYPDDSAVVGPFDMPFRQPGHPTEPPTIAGIAPISLQEFEAQWEQFAQPRLHALAIAHPAQAHDASIRYFHSPFPAEFKIAEAASDIYTEYAAGAPRRSFEVFADCTLVAPYDVGIPAVDSDEMLQAVHGLDDDGMPFDPRLRPEEISHAMFEALWEQQALPRLRQLARLSSSTRDGSAGRLCE